MPGKKCKGYGSGGGKGSRLRRSADPRKTVDKNPKKKSSRVFGKG